MKIFLNLLLTLVAAIMWLTPNSADAKVYKCEGTDGKVAYSQKPCALDSTTETVLQGASVSERFNCRVPRAFSTHIAKQMLEGRSSDDLLAEYGGVNTMSSTAVSVIRYVYSHEGDADVSVNQIAALAGARCEGGAYSKETQCEHFPPSFIKAVGGCAVAKGETRQANNTNTESGEPSLGSALPPQREFAVDAETQTHKNYSVLNDSVEEVQTNCRTQIMTEIRDVQTIMRGRLSIDERTNLNNKRFSLRRKFESC